MDVLQELRHMIFVDRTPSMDGRNRLDHRRAYEIIDNTRAELAKLREENQRLREEVSEVNAEITSLTLENDRIRAIRQKVKIGASFREIFEDCQNSREYWEETVAIIEEEYDQLKAKLDNCKQLLPVVTAELQRRGKIEVLREVLAKAEGEHLELYGFELRGQTGWECIGIALRDKLKQLEAQ